MRLVAEHGLQLWLPLQADHTSPWTKTTQYSEFQGQQHKSHRKIHGLASLSHNNPLHKLRSQLFNQQPFPRLMGSYFMFFSLFLGHRSTLEPLLERRISTSSRAEELPMKDDGDNRICKLKRKEWSISRSQVIVEKEPEAELTAQMVKNPILITTAITKPPAGAECFHCSQPGCSGGASLNTGRGSNTKIPKCLHHLSNSFYFFLF